LPPSIGRRDGNCVIAAIPIRAYFDRIREVCVRVVIITALLLLSSLSSASAQSTMSTTGQSALQRAEERFAARDLEGASAAYREATSLPADANRAWLGLARVALLQQKSKEAFAALEKIQPPAPRVVQLLRSDDAFSPLRSTAQYASLMERLDPCNSAAARQFDFWLGEWEVKDAAGMVLGHNRVERILNGCAVAEYWTSAGGNVGQSINFYDAKTKRWNQFWVDTSGDAWFSRDAQQNPATARGGMQNGKMVLESDPASQPRIRGTWSVLPDGRVRQTFEQSEDKGKTWSAIFDGFYSRRG
jgi:hypothetical protein